MEKILNLNKSILIKGAITAAAITLIVSLLIVQNPTIKAQEHTNVQEQNKVQHHGEQNQHHNEQSHHENNN